MHERMRAYTHARTASLFTVLVYRKLWKHGCNYQLFYTTWKNFNKAYPFLTSYPLFNVVPLIWYLRAAIGVVKPKTSWGEKGLFQLLVHAP